LYSIMCVSDRAKALQWYGVFFGRAADEVIGGEHLWQVGENAWVVVDDRDVRAERVGGAMITLGVTGLDDIQPLSAVRLLAAFGRAPRPNIEPQTGQTGNEYTARAPATVSDNDGQG
jgi:hypothetical protein